MVTHNNRTIRQKFYLKLVLKAIINIKIKYQCFNASMNKKEQLNTTFIKLIRKKHCNKGDTLTYNLVST